MEKEARDAKGNPNVCCMTQVGLKRQVSLQVKSMQLLPRIIRHDEQCVKICFQISFHRNELDEMYNASLQANMLHR